MMVRVKVVTDRTEAIAALNAPEHYEFVIYQGSVETEDSDPYRFCTVYVADRIAGSMKPPEGWKHKNSKRGKRSYRNYVIRDALWIDVQEQLNQIFEDVQVDAPPDTATLNE